MPDSPLWAELVQGDSLYGGAGMDALNLGDASRRVMWSVEQVPLASAGDLARLFGWSTSTVNRALNELVDRRLVDRLGLGAARTARFRFFVRDECARLVGPSFAMWHADWALCRFVDRLPVVEGVYEAAAGLPGLGKLGVFQWFGRAVWDAAAMYEGGWAAFIWSGLWQDEYRVRRVLERFGDDLVRLCVMGESAWPATVCFVVHDQWQRELVGRAARREGLEEFVSVWCLADSQWSGNVSPDRCRGWVAEYVYAREAAPGAWKRKMNSNIWEMSRTNLTWRVMLAVAEWDRITSTGVQVATAEGSGGRRVFSVLQSLEKQGYLDRRWDGKKYRYSGTAQLRRMMAGLDRVRRTGLPGGYGRALGADERGLASHEDGVMTLVGWFLQRGLACASGWRSWEHLGGGGGIAPDGMVYLPVSPFGPGWHYLEYERRAQGKVRVGRKVNGYVAEGRQDTWPVLFALENARVEDTFWEVASGLPVRMATSTMRRLRQMGVLGAGAWRVADGEVSLG